MWKRLARADPPAGSGPATGGAVRERDRVAGLMTPDQIAEAQRLAREWDAAHPREP